MDVLSACMIDTRVVYGFKGAGKTHYISDCIRNDFFYKTGKTLILCLERGEEIYDTAALSEKNTSVEYFEGPMSIRDFFAEQIKKHEPDRIYVEMNTKFPSARDMFLDVMNVTYTVTWIDWPKINKYLNYFKQTISQMVKESQQVTFRNCPSKDLLNPYSQEFRLMNHRASYLREDPMGYHEKAFDLFVPYSLEEEIITISSKEYLIFWLDAADHPEHYDEKIILFTDPIELRNIYDDGIWSAGHVVMTCCMADLQFMSFMLLETEKKISQGGWITMKAFGRLSKDEYGRQCLKLEPEHLDYVAAPKGDIILRTNLPQQNIQSKIKLKESN